MLELMENVEILSKEEIIESIPPLFGLLPLVSIWLALLVAVVGTLISLKLSSITENFSVFVFGAALSFALECTIFLIFDKIITPELTKEVPTGRYQYEVVIKDDSAIKEIYDNYEIVEVKGAIYTIQDKPVASEEGKR